MRHKNLRVRSRLTGVFLAAVIALLATVGSRWTHAQGIDETASSAQTQSSAGVSATDVSSAKIDAPAPSQIQTSSDASTIASESSSTALSQASVTDSSASAANVGDQQTSVSAQASQSAEESDASVSSSDDMSSASFDTRTTSSDTPSTTTQLAPTATLITDTQSALPRNVAPVFLVPRHRDIASADELQQRLRVIAAQADEQPLELTFTVEAAADGYRVSIVPPTTFHPGNYDLQVLLTQQRGVGRALQRFLRLMSAQDQADTVLLDTRFDWGTTAFNIDSDAYRQNDTLHLAAAAIDVLGNPVCLDTLSVATADGTPAAASPSCDGSVSLPLTTIGSVPMTLHAVNDGAAMTLHQTVSVSESTAALTIRRTAPTRSEPGSDQTMRIDVTSAHGWTGSVQETVPSGFTVSAVQPQATVVTLESGDTQIVWSGKIEPGETRTYTYHVMTPAAAPLFALWQPLELHGTSLNSSAPAATSSAAPASSVSSEASASVAASSSASVSSATETSQATVSSDASPSSAGGSESEPGSAQSSADVSVPTSASDAATVPTPQSDASASSASANGSAAPVDGTVQGFIPWIERMIAAAFLHADAQDASTVYEQRQWQMLVAHGDPLLPEQRTRTLTLEAQAQVFDANAAPTFKLVDTQLTDQAQARNADGTMKPRVALVEMLSALLSKDEASHEALTQVVKNQASAIVTASLAQNDTRQSVIDAATTALPSTATVPDIPTALRTAIGMQQSVADSMATTVENSAQTQATVEALAASMSVEGIANGIAAQTGSPTDNVTVDSLQNAFKGTVEQATTALGGDTTSTVTTAIASAAETANVLADALVAGTDALPAATEQKPVLRLTLTGPHGEKMENPPAHFAVGSVNLVLDPIRSFTPGLYMLTATFTNPLTGEEQTFSQNFAWGVLAINASQDHYDVGDTAHLDIGVLDDAGNIVCDAKLQLDVTSPSGTTQRLTTEHGDIETTGTCGKKEAGFIEPDFQTTLSVPEQGTYQLELFATTKNGTRSLQSTIMVGTKDAFTVTRTAATRLWPFALSPMDITVQCHADVDGWISDTVPAGFVVSHTQPDANIVEGSGSTSIRWRGNYKKGDTVHLHYDYDAPDISPHFYLMGPLEIRARAAVSSSSPAETPTP